MGCGEGGAANPARRRAREAARVFAAVQEALNERLPDGSARVLRVMGARLRSRARAQRWLACGPKVRRALAALALAEVNEPWVPELLATALGGGEPAVRAMAAEGLERWWLRWRPGQQAPKELVAALAALLKDPCDAVRAAAIPALACVGGDDGARALAEWFYEAPAEDGAEVLMALARNGYNAAAARLLWRARAAEPRAGYVARLGARLGDAPAMGLGATLRADEAAPGR